MNNDQLPLHDGWEGDRRIVIDLCSSSTMILFTGLIYTLLLFALGKQQATTWYIDANNMLGSRGTPRDSQVLADRLKCIKGAEAVILVFDGKRDQESAIENEGNFRKVLLGEGMSADDYIINEINGMLKNMPSCKVQVVTADRDLRRKVLQAKAVVRTVVNPVTFWKRYLPRLSGLKQKPTQSKENNVME